MTDLRNTHGLSLAQFRGAFGDKTVRVPDDLNAPVIWANSEPSDLDMQSSRVPRVFLSYHVADGVRAEALRDLLVAERVEVWWHNKLSTSALFDGSPKLRMMHDMERSMVVLTLWTKTSVHSDEIIERAEWSNWAGTGVHTRLDYVEIPRALDEFIGYDLADWDGTAEHPAFRALVTRLKMGLAGPLPLNWEDDNTEPQKEESISPAGNPAAEDKSFHVLPVVREAPVVEVTWTEGTLSARYVLAAREPGAALVEAQRVDGELQASLGQLASQISGQLRTKTPANAVRFTGDASMVFDVVAEEIAKDEPLSFVIEANVAALRVLCASEDAEALREVDAALITSFLGLADRWRVQSGLLEGLNADLVPEDRLEEIEAAETALVALVTAEDNADQFAPSLPGVTRDMALYPWDPDDPIRNRRLRAAALGTLAAQIWKSLISPPPGVVRTGSFYAALLGAAAAVLALFPLK